MALSSGVAAALAVVVIALVLGGFGFFAYLKAQQDQDRQEVERQRADAERSRQEADNAKRQAEDILKRQEEREKEVRQRRDSVPPPEPQPTPEEPKEDPRTIRINAKNVRTSGYWYPFTVPKGGGVLSGRLEGVGGIKGEFNVHIVNDRQLTDFRNGQRTDTFYSNNDLTVNDVNVNLPAGQYYVLLQSSSGWTGRDIIGMLKILK